MRILLTNTTAAPVIGGVENSLRFIGRELLRAGHEVKIFCLQTSLSQPLCCHQEEIEVIRVPFVAKRWPHARLRQIVRTVCGAVPPVLDSFQPDAVWSRSAPVGLGVALGGFKGPLLQIFCTTTRMDTFGLYLQTSGLPIFRRLMLLGLYPLHYQEAFRIERNLLKVCQPVVFSYNMHSQLQRSGHPKEISVIPPGVDTSIFSAERGAAFVKEIEQRYGLGPDMDIILYVGRLSTAKNINLLIDALAFLPASAMLVLVGSGREEMRLRAYAKKKHFDARVLFVGNQLGLLPGFYSLAKVCVLPTTIESFGQVYLESLACGTPAVGFAGDGRRVLTATTEILRNGETGAVAETVSAEALAEKIDSILSLGDNDYAIMSQGAQSEVRRRFSWQRFVNEAVSLSMQKMSEGGGV